MRVHILGCGDAFGSGGRNQSGYLVEAADRLFLLDCGPTTLLAMKRAGFDPKRLDVIFLTHLHGDHYGGVPFFLLQYLYQTPRDTILTVAGPPGTEEKVCGLFRLMYGSGSDSKELPLAKFHHLEPENEEIIQGIQVFPFRVPHQVHEISLAIKISYEGKQLLFSGDSAWTDLFLTHARSTDLFLCECCFYDRETPNHMNYQRLRENLPQLDCKKIVLTHMGDEMLARRKELPVITAEDGMIIEI